MLLFFLDSSWTFKSPHLRLFCSRQAHGSSSSSGINGGRKQQDRERGRPAGEAADGGGRHLWGRGDEPAWGTCTGVPGLGGGGKVEFSQENSVGSALCTPNSVQVTGEQGWNSNSLWRGSPLSQPGQQGAHRGHPHSHKPLSGCLLMVSGG